MMKGRDQMQNKQIYRLFLIVFAIFLLHLGCSESKESELKSQTLLASQTRQNPILSIALVVQETENPSQEDEKETHEVEEVFETLERAGIHAAIQLLQTSGMDSFTFGRNLVKSGDHDRALQWYIGLIKISSGTEKSKFYFEKSWLHYRRGELDQAKRDGGLVLKAYTSDVVIARTHYMLGMIHTRWNKRIEALKHFEISEKHYRDEGNYNGMYVCTIERATIEIYAENYKEGYLLIDLANSYRLKAEHPYRAGRIHELRAHEHFRNANYLKFIEHAELALEEFQADRKKDSVLWVRITIALAWGLQGDFSKAYTWSKKNDDLIIKVNNPKAWYYNNLTWVLMNRCQGYDYLEMKEEIEKWGETAESKEQLLELLALVENVECRN